MYWIDRRIPDGAVVRYVDMYYKTANSNLEAVRFLDADRKVLIAVGLSEDISWLQDPDYSIPVKTN